MRIRTVTELIDFLDSEFAWRQKELTRVISDVKTANDKSRSLRLRSGVTILYAHWEGFIKQAGEAYLSFVARRRFKLNNLDYCFLVLSLRKKLSNFQESNRIDSQIKFVEHFLNHMEDRAQIPKSGVINTGSNLSSERLKQIVITLGLDYQPYELKANRIDSQLLSWRNSIAHGRQTLPNQNEFSALHTEICTLIRVFKDQISNAVVTKQYYRKAK